jgi:hypothetical protein
MLIKSGEIALQYNDHIAAEFVGYRVVWSSGIWYFVIW